MRRLETSPYELALRYVGVREVAGQLANPLILAMLRLDDEWPEDDSVPWCSAFVNWIAWHFRLPRSKSLRARSWLSQGEPIGAHVSVLPEPGTDIVVLKRGGRDEPGPDVLDAPGHVGFYAGFQPDSQILVLGGNQADSVSIATFDAARVLGYRRLA